MHLIEFPKGNVQRSLRQGDALRYAETWETRQDEMKALLANGKLPYYQDMEKMEEEGLDKEAYAKKVGLR